MRLVHEQRGTEPFGAVFASRAHERSGAIPRSEYLLYIRDQLTPQKRSDEFAPVPCRIFHLVLRSTILRPAMTVGQRIRRPRDELDGGGGMEVMAAAAELGSAWSMA